MKTLADVKRAAQVGVTFQCEHHLRPEVSGERRVAKVQGNGIWYDRLDHADDPHNRRCWVTWGSARDIRVEGNRVTFMRDGAPAFTYTFPEKPIATIRASDATSAGGGG